MNDTNLPEFDEVRKSFEDAGRFFTGIVINAICECCTLFTSTIIYVKFIFNFSYYDQKN